MAEQEAKRGFIQEFREFAMRGSVVDLAVGVIIGASFNKIVQSLVDDLIMPPIGMILGKMDFSNLMYIFPGQTVPPGTDTPAEAKAAGLASLNYGAFINNILQFIIVAFAVFLLVRAINRLRARTEEPAPVGEPVIKQCPYCLTDIPIKAVKCAHCTADLAS